MVEDYNEKFLSTMKDLEPYLLEFDKDRSMKKKKYLNNCTIEGNKHWPVIIITHNECIFFINNKI